MVPSNLPWITQNNFVAKKRTEIKPYRSTKIPLYYLHSRWSDWDSLRNCWLLQDRSWTAYKRASLKGGEKAPFWMKLQRFHFHSLRTWIQTLMAASSTENFLYKQGKTMPRRNLCAAIKTNGSSKLNLLAHPKVSTLVKSKEGRLWFSYFNYLCAKRYKTYPVWEWALCPYVPGNKTFSDP